jgi:hypothetical protein
MFGVAFVRRYFYLTEAYTDCLVHWLYIICRVQSSLLDRVLDSFESELMGESRELIGPGIL